MALSLWLSLALVCMMGAMSPGPSLAVVLKHSLSGGMKNGMLAALSHGFGVGLYAAASLLGADQPPSKPRHSAERAEAGSRSQRRVISSREPAVAGCRWQRTRVSFSGRRSWVSPEESLPQRDPSRVDHGPPSG